MPSNTPNYSTGETYGPIQQSIGPYQAGQYVSASDWSQWQQQASQLYQSQSNAMQQVAQSGGSAADAQAAEGQAGQKVQQQLAGTKLASPPPAAQPPAAPGSPASQTPPATQPPATNINLQPYGPKPPGTGWTPPAKPPAGWGGYTPKPPSGTATTATGTWANNPAVRMTSNAEEGPPVQTSATVVNAPAPTAGPVGGVSGSPSTPTNYVGGDITQMAQNNRDLAIAQGQNLGSQFGYQYGVQAGQADQYRRAADTAYDPNNNTTGFSADQTKAITGEPGDAVDQYAPVARGAVQDATKQVYSDVNDLAAAGQTAQQYAGGVLANDVGNYAGLASDYLDPNALNTSQDFNSNYNFSPQDQQNIIESAGVNAGQAGQAQSDSIARAAAAAGNSSPLAIAAAEDRARYTGQINASDAMTNAAIKAKQLGLQTDLTKEQTRLGAAQDYAGKGLAAAGNVNSAAMQAGEYAGTQEQNILQNQSQQLQSAGENLLGQNLGSLGTQAGLRQTAEQQQAARALTVAQQQKTDLQKYRDYLTSEQEAASQNENVAGQQQLGALGVQTGAANGATTGAIQNYAVPGFGQTALNDILKIGATAAGAYGSIYGPGGGPLNPGNNTNTGSNGSFPGGLPPIFGGGSVYSGGTNGNGDDGGGDYGFTNSWASSAPPPTQYAYADNTPSLPAAATPSSNSGGYAGTPAASGGYGTDSKPPSAAPSTNAFGSTSDSSPASSTKSDWGSYGAPQSNLYKPPNYAGAPSSSNKASYV